MASSDRPSSASHPTGGEAAPWGSKLADQIEERGPMLFRLAYSFLRDAAAAEDVCQEAFLKAWRQKGLLRDETALGRWLVRVVTNESLQVLRRRKAGRKAMVAKSLRLTTPIPPDEQVEIKDTVLVALSELPERTRLVVVLRLMQGHTGNEVKKMLNCSASEVSRHLHEGMERLRRFLEEPRT